MLKVAIITPFYLPVPAVKGGGVESLIEALVKINEQENKIELTVFSPFQADAFKAAKKYTYTKFIFIKISQTLRKFNKHISKLLRKHCRIYLSSNYFVSEAIKNQLNKIKYDVIVVENNYHLALSLAESNYNNLYLHIHNDPGQNESLLYSKISKHLFKYIAVSDYIKNQIVKSFKCEPASVDVLLNCIDLTKFISNNLQKRAELKHSLKIEDSDLVFVFSGRIDARKGIFLLVKAFLELDIEQPAKLLVIGNDWYSENIDGPNLSRLKEMTREHSERFVFTGFIDNKSLPQYLSVADIAIIPSTAEEGAGLVAIEAMASGLPLIVTNSGGLPEYATSDCAIVIEKDNSILENLRQALQLLANDQDLRSNMAINAINNSRKFSELEYYYNFLNVINKNSI